MITDIDNMVKHNRVTEPAHNELRGKGPGRNHAYRRRPACLIECGSVAVCNSVPYMKWSSYALCWNFYIENTNWLIIEDT